MVALVYMLNLESLWDCQDLPHFLTDWLGRDRPSGHLGQHGVWAPRGSDASPSVLGDTSLCLGSIGCCGVGQTVCHTHGGHED